jgi:hypothetical protein
MHLTGIKPATDTEHASHCITEYFGRPTRDDPLDERQHISIYIAYNKHPIHNYKCENNLYILLINNDDADNSFLMMIGVPQSAVHGWRITCLAGAICGTGSVPLHIDVKMFHIDAFLNISNNSDVMLRTPRLANIGRVTWDFNSMVMQFQRDKRAISFTTIPRQHTPQTVLTLLAPLAITPAAHNQAVVIRSESPLTYVLIGKTKSLSIPLP